MHTMNYHISDPNTILDEHLSRKMVWSHNFPKMQISLKEIGRNFLTCVVIPSYLSYALMNCSKMYENCMELIENGFNTVF